MIINDAGDVLEAAALEIENHGWTQYKLRSEIGKVCVVGAIYAVTSAKGELQSRVFYYLQKAVGLCLITVWNDSICKSQEQAVDTLRHAAKLSREAEE